MNGESELLERLARVEQNLNFLFAVVMMSAPALGQIPGGQGGEGGQAGPGGAAAGGGGGAAFGGIGGAGGNAYVFNAPEAPREFLAWLTEHDPELAAAYPAHESERGEWWRRVGTQLAHTAGEIPASVIASLVTAMLHLPH